MGKRQDIAGKAEKLIVILFVLSGVMMCITGCQEKTQTQGVSYDNTSIGGNLGTAAGCDGMLEKMINDSCVKVIGASVTAGDVRYTLDSYYYNPSENIAAYGVRVTNSDGGQLSNDKKEKLKTDFSSDNLYFSFGVYNEKCTYEEISDDNDLHISGVNILADRGEEKLSKLHYLAVMAGKEEYDINLPDYSVESKCVNYRVFTAEELKKCMTGEKTLTMVYDTSQREKELKEELKEKKKELGDNFNEEDYGYVMYTDVKLKMKDGRQIDIYNENGVGKNVVFELSGVDESMNLETFQVLLDDNIDMSQVYSVVVDGVGHTAIE